jgi:adenylate cyclase
MGPAEFEAAGLYDPEAPNAADHLALLDWLAGRGVTLEQMVTEYRAGQITALAGNLALEADRVLTLDELAARSGLTPARVVELGRAMGVPPVDAGAARPFGTDDLRAYTAIAVASELFGEEATRRFARVIGSSLGRLAEAAVWLFLENLEGPLRRSNGSELSLAQANLQAIEMLGLVPETMQGLFRQHVATAIRRMRAARGPGATAAGRVDTACFAVGFVDLVGFTQLAQRASAQELAALVERFEDTANDVAIARDGRVVKLIGDEVMFAAVDPGAACEIALELMARLCCDVPARPRGGIAWGEMVVRGGDYYGPIVNLAARIAEQAVPDELLVTPELAARAQRAGLRFEPAGKRMLKGFDAPVALMTVERA